MLPIIGVSATAGAGEDREASAPVDGRNAIEIENARPGDPTWDDDVDWVALEAEARQSLDLLAGESLGSIASDDHDTVRAAATVPYVSPYLIEGYATAPSVNKGGSIGFAVSSRGGNFDIQIVRQGWYDGVGARFITDTSNVAGVDRGYPAIDPTTGLIEANWPVSYTLQTTAAWTSGVYLAQLTRTGTTKVESSIPFVVRDDASTARLLYVLPTNTWQAFNAWGGKSTFSFDSGGAATVAGTTRAVKVSYNRPYEGGAGTGQFLNTDVSLVHFLEREGYDVTYATSLDFETNPSLLGSRRAFVTSWQDQYTTLAQRNQLEAARSGGKFLAFLGSGNNFWQVRFEASGATPNRTMVSYKLATIDPFATDATPANDGLVTVTWREPPVNRPEDALQGAQYNFHGLGYGNAVPYVAQSASHWIYRGTGVVDGSTIANLVGYDYDELAGSTVPNRVVLGSTAVPAGAGGTGGGTAVTTYYDAASGGGGVFNAGTPHWVWLLDGYDTTPGPASPQVSHPVDSRVQQMTRNVLYRALNGVPPATAPLPRSTESAGYWMIGSDGLVYSFGAAANFGNAGGLRPLVDLEPTPTFQGYWVIDDQGAVQAFGDARGDLGNGTLSAAQLAAGEVVTAISATPYGNGYWIFTNRGRVLNKGDAGHFGDVSHLALNGPVLDSIAMPTGQGYFMVASDGGIFAFGDAKFAGSMGGKPLNAPVQSLVPTATGNGYWLVAADGGIFAFGDAGFVGSIPGVLRAGQSLNRPITGMVRYGNGYLMVGEDGGIFSFSSQPFLGSLGATPPARPIVSVAAQGT